MSYNSQIGNNEYTNLEQRRKQYLSQLSVSQDPVVTAGSGGGKGGTGGTGGGAAVAAPSEADRYTSFLKEMKAAQDAEYKKQQEAYEKQQAELKAQQGKLRDTRIGQLNDAYDSSKANLDTAKKAANRDAYVAYMHGLKNMPQISAVSGNGGYAQSLATKQQINYENNRGGIEQKYLDNLRQLEAEKNAGITAAEEAYLNGIMGLEANAQNYLNQLAALNNNTDSYSAQMASIVEKAKTPAVSSSVKAAATTTPTATSAANTYKLNGKTYTDQEFIAYLKGQGMTQAEIARYMQSHGLIL